MFIKSMLKTSELKIFTIIEMRTDKRKKSIDVILEQSLTYVYIYIKQNQLIVEQSFRKEEKTMIKN